MNETQSLNCGSCRFWQREKAGPDLIAECYGAPPQVVPSGQPPPNNLTTCRTLTRMQDPACGLYQTRDAPHKGDNRRTALVVIGVEKNKTDDGYHAVFGRVEISAVPEVVDAMTLDGEHATGIKALLDQVN